MIDLHTHTNDSDGTWNLFVHPYCIKQFEKVKKIEYHEKRFAFIANLLESKNK